jgi:hypothetical protein
MKKRKDLLEMPGDELNDPNAVCNAAGMSLMNHLHYRV